MGDVVGKVGFDVVEGVLVEDGGDKYGEGEGEDDEDKEGGSENGGDVVEEEGGKGLDGKGVEGGIERGGERGYDSGVVGEGRDVGDIE